MQKRSLTPEIEVSILGLGTVKFGRNQGVKYPHGFNLPTEIDISNLLSMASEHGINLLDTAPAYGESEARLGKLLKEQRHDWVISSKAGEIFTGECSYYDFTPAAIIKSVEQSLRRLNTDYLDLLLIHSDGNDEEIIHKHQIFDTLKNLQQQGKIRASGFSSKTLVGGMLALEHLDVVMATLRPDALAELPIIEQAAATHKSVIIKKALSSGHQIHNIQEVFKFLLSYVAIKSIIVGTINPMHLLQNIRAIQQNF